MRDKILQDALKWYDEQGTNPDISDFVDMVILKTTDAILEDIKSELKNEFTSGNLQHPFVISSD